jgi:hypothetical protein
MMKSVAARKKELWNCWRFSVETVRATAEEFEEAEIAEDLELLADFGLDVVIVGVEFFEGVFEGVDFGQLEFGFSEGADGVEDVEGPAAFFKFKIGEGFEAAVGTADFGGWSGAIFFHNGNARVDGDAVEEDVAADPAGAAGGWRKGLASLDSGKCEREIRNEYQRAYSQRKRLILEQKQVRSLPVQDCRAHF